jgi:hypothetical protein
MDLELPLGENVTRQLNVRPKGVNQTPNGRAVRSRSAGHRAIDRSSISDSPGTSMHPSTVLSYFLGNC